MDDRVKLKIPVGTKLASTIEQLAKDADRSQSWIAAQALAVLVNDNEHLAGWLYWRVTGGVLAAMKSVAKLRGVEVEPIEPADRFLQVYVSSDLSSELARIAKKMNLSQADAVAQMLYCAIEIEGWLIGVANSPPVRTVQRITGLSGTGNVKGNREPDKHLKTGVTRPELSRSHRFKPKTA